MEEREAGRGRGRLRTREAEAVLKQAATKDSRQAGSERQVKVGEGNERQAGRQGQEKTVLGRQRL